MRRNINILNKTKMRSGMAMIMAIAFLVIIAGMMAVMMSMTSLTTARTEQMYFKEQAQLLARSATEFALLAISGHNRLGNASCVNQINSQFPVGGVNAPYFTIRTNIRYIGLAGAAGTCAGVNNYIPTPFAPVGGVPHPIAPESDGTVLIDVYVTDIPGQLNLSNPIAYHRRTLQKP